MTLCSSLALERLPSLILRVGSPVEVKVVAVLPVVAVTLAEAVCLAYVKQTIPFIIR